MSFSIKYYTIVKLNILSLNDRIFEKVLDPNFTKAAYNAPFMRTGIVFTGFHQIVK